MRFSVGKKTRSREAGKGGTHLISTSFSRAIPATRNGTQILIPICVKGFASQSFQQNPLVCVVEEDGKGLVRSVVSQ